MVTRARQQYVGHLSFIKIEAHWLKAMVIYVNRFLCDIRPDEARGIKASRRSPLVRRAQLSFSEDRPNIWSFVA